MSANESAIFSDSPPPFEEVPMRPPIYATAEHYDTIMAESWASVASDCIDASRRHLPDSDEASRRLELARRCRERANGIQRQRSNRRLEPQTAQGIRMGSVKVKLKDAAIKRAELEIRHQECRRRGRELRSQKTLWERIAGSNAVGANDGSSGGFDAMSLLLGMLIMGEQSSERSSGGLRR